MSVRMHFFSASCYCHLGLQKDFPATDLTHGSPVCRAVGVLFCTPPRSTEDPRAGLGLQGASSLRPKGVVRAGRVAALSGSIRPPRAPHPAHAWQSPPGALRQEGSPGLAMPGLSQPLDRLEAVLLPLPPGVLAARGEVPRGWPWQRSSNRPSATQAGAGKASLTWDVGRW